MSTDRFQDLAYKWLVEAEQLRRLEASGQAATLERAADELDAVIREWIAEPLTIREASEESGYTEDRLRALVRGGVIPDARSAGSHGEIRIRRCDLPRKPGLASQHSTPENDFASRVAAHRKEATHG
jgi:hypothetical protein